MNGPKNVGECIKEVGKIGGGRERRDARLYHKLGLW